MKWYKYFSMMLDIPRREISQKSMNAGVIACGVMFSLVSLTLDLPSHFNLLLTFNNHILKYISNR
jgi:hypothetical protein